VPLMGELDECAKADVSTGIMWPEFPPPSFKDRMKRVEVPVSCFVVWQEVAQVGTDHQEVSRGHDLLKNSYHICRLRMAYQERCPTKRV
jgi:hypothetical protein